MKLVKDRRINKNLNHPNPPKIFLQPCEKNIEKVFFSTQPSTHFNSSPLTLTTALLPYTTTMARRRHKKRTHVEDSEDAVDNTPKSMVIKLTRRGALTSNPSLSQLVHDVRQLMQPHTAIRLRERSTNKLRDFVTMTGPLGVTHLMVFSVSAATGNTNLRICRTPHGPTMQFKVLEYSLCKDLNKVIKAPKSPSGVLFANPPLLVLNGFSADRKAAPHESLLTSMFQNMFPAISVQETKVGGIKRVLLLSKDPETDEIELRHYAIETKMVDVSKGVKRLASIKTRTHKSIPNLSKAKDISELITDPYSAAGGYTSESEVEDDALVEIEQRKKIRIKARDAAALKKNGSTVAAREREDEEGGDEDQDEDQKAEEQDDRELFPTTENHPDLNSKATTTVTESLGTQKRAIKLIELGPRLKLELRKIEEGTMGSGKDGNDSGKVLYHRYIKKSDKEIKEIEKKIAEKERMRAERRKAQELNVKKKQEEKGGTRMQRGKEKARAKEASEKGENGDENNDDNDDNESGNDNVGYDGYSDDDLRDDDNDLFASDGEGDNDDDQSTGNKKRKTAHFDDLGEESE